jgi:hypothetical protein
VRTQRLSMYSLGVLGFDSNAWITNLGDLQDTLTSQLLTRRCSAVRCLQLAFERRYVIIDIPILISYSTQTTSCDLTGEMVRTPSASEK